MIDNVKHEPLSYLELDLKWCVQNNKEDSLNCWLLKQRNPDEEEMSEMIDGEKGRIEREMSK